MTQKSLAQPQTMRALGLFGLHDLRLIDLDYPGSPGPGEVLLKVATVGICGSDHHYYNEGAIGDAIVDQGMVMGHEFAAWIAETGDGVQELAVGQLVAVDPAIPCGVCESCLHGHPNLCPNVLFCGSPNHVGAMADYIRMPAENCFPLPEGMTPAEGAMLEPLGVAIHAVDLGHLKVGDTVAILGAGPIGLLTAAVARAAGAGMIYMTEPVASRRAFAQSYTADLSLDPSAEDIVKAILEGTGGRGVDVAFEAAGATETPDQAARVTRPGGKVVLVGIPDDDTTTMTASVIRRKGLTIKVVRRMKHTYPRAIGLVHSGIVDVARIATHVFPAEQAKNAFQLVDSYGDGVLRALIVMGEETE